ncbi:unnamed protein product [Rotaria sp. Silwood2]|nr:unnamed protein product [Rotaria sp. Silwood2]CAF2912342.1 unnamed protein product [Rotaria sp. Silwood2]CAF3321638.1 unnamed protein product [Rotaria sp. Silwood2]CAF4412327.1 unnamed protein product [Rotaria sp. Silwood2]CAF4624565.1 unnamed protein product [Rotaria sp. Silwood2]
MPDIPVDAQWEQNGITIGGDHGWGGTINQLRFPKDLFFDNTRTLLIADSYNNRIIQWSMNNRKLEVVAGGNGAGNGLNQLNEPTDVLIDKTTNSLVINDLGNKRVVRWSRRSGTIQGEILLDNIDGDKNGSVVAGGNGQGDKFNQLNHPNYIFVDPQQTIYVSDNYNHRVMKWNKNSTEGIIVAGGNGQGNNMTQLNYPDQLIVDISGTLYVADSQNNRVIRWTKQATYGTVIVGENGHGGGANQLKWPRGLSFDRDNNLCVSDTHNNRVQQFYFKNTQK